MFKIIPMNKESSLMCHDRLVELQRAKIMLWTVTKTRLVIQIDRIYMQCIADFSYLLLCQFDIVRLSEDFKLFKKQGYQKCGYACAGEHWPHDICDRPPGRRRPAQHSGRGELRQRGRPTNQTIWKMNQLNLNTHESIKRSGICRQKKSCFGEYAKEQK